jgi:acetyl esterase/lipase
LTASLMKWLLNSTSSISTLRAMTGFGSQQRMVPSSVTSRPELAAGVAVEWIIPDTIETQTVILFLHGGGWTLGWYNSHRSLLSQLCLATKCRGLAVDYRLAPEHPFPAGLDDCLMAYRWLLKQGIAPKNITVAGDSAGGNLTLATLLALRDAGDPLPAGAVSISGMLDLDGTGETFNTINDPLLTPKFALSMARHYVGDQDARSPLISPYYADLHGLPPLLLQVGAEEILLSDSTRFAEKARAAGVAVTLEVWPEMWHVWHVFAPFLPEAKQAVESIGKFVATQASSH